jgi:hypothetical protein
MKIILTLLCSFCLTLLAQDFEVAPVVLNFTATTKTPQSIDLYITNHDETPNTYKLSFSDEYFGQDGKRQYIEAGSTINSCYKWISMDREEILVGPEQTGSITLTLSPSNPGANKTKWLTAFVGIQKENIEGVFEKKSTQTGIRLIPRIAVKIIQNFNEKTNVSFEIIDSTILFNKLNDVLSFRLKNTTEGEVKQFKYFYSSFSETSNDEYQSAPTTTTLYPNQIKDITYDLSYLSKGAHECLFLIDPGVLGTLKAIRKRIIIE